MESQLIKSTHHTGFPLQSHASRLGSPSPLKLLCYFISRPSHRKCALGATVVGPSLHHAHFPMDVLPKTPLDRSGLLCSMKRPVAGCSPNGRSCRLRRYPVFPESRQCIDGYSAKVSYAGPIPKGSPRPILLKNPKLPAWRKTSLHDSVVKRTMPYQVPSNGTPAHENWSFFRTVSEAPSFSKVSARS